MSRYVKILVILILQCSVKIVLVNIKFGKTLQFDGTVHPKN